MTFTEAALAVLEREGRPMHSREIAEKAVELGILSHVGKTPVQTMSARLSTAVAKGREEALFIRIRPGVFALSTWEGKSPGPPSTVPQEKKAAVENPQETSEPAHPSKKKRRRRKKRVEDTENNVDKEPSVPRTSSEPPKPSFNPVEDGGRPAPQDRGRSAPQDRGRSATQDGGRSAPQNGGRSATQDGGRPSTQARQVPTKGNEGSSLAAESLAKTEDLVDRIEIILRSHTRPVSPAMLAEQFGRRGDNATTLVEALLVADGLDRESKGLRPRFVEHRNGFALAEREVSDDIISCERHVAEAKKRLVRIAERQILRKLRALPMKAFVQVMALHLQRSGFEAMVPVDRGQKDEFHLSVQDRRHRGRFRTAVVLRRDSSTESLSDRAVMDLRGALHHYNATSGMIVTTGIVGEKARVEAFVPNLPPVALLDGEMLAREMVRLGIGIRDRIVTLPSFDDVFFTSLES
ncbi:MAG: hypothetical protein GY847_35300 [Proteobacteria bacterium]|nr:hypothetical protein [Pseudomonadota bacterium]